MTRKLLSWLWLAGAALMALALLWCAYVYARYGEDPGMMSICLAAAWTLIGVGVIVRRTNGR